MGIEAETRKGELGHVGAANQHEPGASQACDGGRILLCRISRKNSRSGPRYLSAHVEQILNRYRYAREARGMRVSRTQPVHRIRRRQRSCPVDGDEGGAALPVRIVDAIKAGLGQRQRRRPSSREIGGERGERRPGHGVRQDRNSGFRAAVRRRPT
jgi:hypothetical protein